MKIISLRLHRVIPMITNVTEGEAQKSCVVGGTDRNPALELPSVKFNTRFPDELSQAKEEKQQQNPQ